MNTKKRIALALLVASATSRGLLAQTNPAAASSANDKVQDEVIQLSPFEVSTVKDTGYQATTTLAGTRIRTDLKDVGAAIAVVTKEFLQDVGATDNGTLLQYTTNAEVSGTRGTYAGLGNGTGVDESGQLRAPAGANRVRGLASADNARDYYITDIPWDSYNVDRIDILRGPNSILFGLGSPAGIVNASLRNAEFRNSGNIEFRTGSYASTRTSIGINQQLIPGVLALRLDGLWNSQKYQQDPAFQNEKRAYGAIRFEPNFFNNPSMHTSIKVKFENGDIDANRPRIIPPNDAISPWFRPREVTASNPFGGMGKTSVNNPYDPYRTDNVVAGDGRGLANSTTVNYQPWLADFANQQQPIWMIDGGTGHLYQAYGAYINNGALNSSGGFTGVSNGLVNKRQNGMLYGLGNLPGVATVMNLPFANYGQYKNMTMTDSSIFDFYNTLIDGDNKREWEEWNAYNVDASQTFLNDRIGVQLSYDRQKYYRGGEGMLGGNPTLTIDITKNLADYYVSGANGTTSITNPNYGRPMVTAGAGSGSDYRSDRKYLRGSLFGEVRATDFLRNGFLTKLLGKHRFNGVASDEKYYNESRGWQMYANSQAWDGYWNGNDGSSNSIASRAPVTVIYLGQSLKNASTAAGANIPGITANVGLQSTGVRVFDTTWKNYSVSPGAEWSVPSSLNIVYNGLPNPESTTQLYQASNPANYVGWTSFQNNLLSYDHGKDLSLLSSAQKSLRQTLSYSGSYQGYLWDDAFVATLGWRFDEVKTKDKTASNLPLQRNILDLSAQTYRLPDEFPVSQIFKGHSTSGGLVVHLNKLLPRDPLPINVSVSYNESSNFQVTSVRRDIYGTPFGNPSGKTYEYGLLLSTKDNKYSLRFTDYTTRVSNGSAQLSNAGGVGGVVIEGLKWRNVFLYQLGGYDWASRNQDSYRNRWTNAYPALSDADAAATLDKAIDGWNDIQKWLEAKGFFKAWNFTPATSSKLTNRTTYLSNPDAYSPDPASISQYSGSAPQGFTVTADTESKGYEAEFTANPLPNWRIAFNASKTTATRSNVGGETLREFINYIDSKLYNADGTFTPAGQVPRWGGAGAAIGPNVWAPWRANYVLMKLQEGTEAPEIRKWRYNVVTNYDFRKGFLKGVGVGGAYRWQDKVIIGYPVITGGSYDLSNPYYGPAEDAVDLWTSYSRKLTDKINWRIQLSVRNAFAKDGLIPISIEPDGKTWASARVKPVQEWFVTNSFSF